MPTSSKPRFAVADLEAGERAGVGTGREDDVLARDGVAADLDGCGGDEPALTLDHGDAAGLDEALESLVLARDDLLAIRGDRRDVDAGQRRVHAVLRRLARDIRYLGRVQERLGRDAPDVEAGAAQLVLLDEADGQAELAGTKRSRIPATSAAEDDKVEILLRQSQQLLL